MITIGIVSFNRFKYIKSLLTSLSNLDRNKFNVVVVDNGSWEKGLSDYLIKQKNNGKITQLYLRETEKRNWINDEYIAKNIIIENCKDETIVFLQDDLQFIVDETYLLKICEDFMNSQFQCLEFNGVRRITNANKFATKKFLISDNKLKYWISDKPHYQTMGIFRQSTFIECGLYPVNWPKEKQYWGRSEDFYDAIVKQKYRHINMSTHFPAFLGVWNDTRGGYAFFRNDLRYAQYIDPVEPNEIYYSQYNFDDVLLKSQLYSSPMSFIDVAKPLGWEIALSSDGDQAKYSQIDIINNEKGQLII